MLFGSLFNDVLIDRINEAGDAVDTLKVPLSYGPKDRYLVRLQENPDLLRQINQVLPRMSFEIKSVEYDRDRKLNTIGKNTNLTNSGDVLGYQYNPVPYNFNIDLSILTRNADDACRIVEQILPFFKPEWTTAINLIPEMGIVMDIPIVLKNINYEDTYEASFNDRYAIIWNLQFVLKGYLFGPISTQGVIKTIDINFHETNCIENYIDAPTVEQVFITPGLDANGNPTSNASLSIPLSQIEANSNYGYIKDWFTNIG